MNSLNEHKIRRRLERAKKKLNALGDFHASID